MDECEGAERLIDVPIGPDVFDAGVGANDDSLPGDEEGSFTDVQVQTQELVDILCFCKINHRKIANSGGREKDLFRFKRRVDCFRLASPHNTQQMSVRTTDKKDKREKDMCVK